MLTLISVCTRKESALLLVSAFLFDPRQLSICGDIRASVLKIRGQRRGIHAVFELDIM